MRIRADKLTLQIQAIQQLIQVNLSKHSIAQTIYHELGKFALTLENKQLKILFIPCSQQATHPEMDLILQAQQLVQQDAGLASAYDICDCDIESDSREIRRDCDVLCVALDDENLIPLLEKQVADYSGSMPQRIILTTDAIATHPSIQQLAKTQGNLEIVTLPNGLDQTDQTGSRSKRRPENQFVKILQALIRRRPEDLLAERLIVNITTLLVPLEELVNREIEQLDQQLLQIKPTATHSLESASSIKQQFDQTVRQLQDDLKQRFTQIKSDLEQSRAEMLDEFNRYSLIHQIQLIVVHLQPQIVRRANAKYIQLCSDIALTGTDVNVDLVQLCYSYLSQWNANQWRKIYALESEYSLSSFLNTAYRQLDQIPHVELSPWKGEAEINAIALRQCFKHPVASATCESYYKEASLISYIIRQMRNQWMSIMFLLTFIAMVSNSNKSNLVKGAFSIFVNPELNPVLLTAMLAVPFCALFAWLFSNHDQDSNQKLQEEANKLKKNLCSYYQSFAKYATDLLLKDFIHQLDTEISQFQQTLNQTRQRLEQELHHIEQQTLQAEQFREALGQQKQSLIQVSDAISKLKAI